MKIIVPMVAPGMNQIRDMHHFEYKRLRETWQRTMWALIGRQKKPVGKVKVSIHVEHTRLYDPDNLVGCAKIPLDCLVRLEVLPNDTPENLTLSVTQSKSKEKQTTILIEEIP